MNQRFGRRGFLQLGGGLAGAALLAAAGCGGSGGGDSASIRFTWWGSTDRHKRTQAALAAYKKKQPEVTVRTQFSGWDGYWEKLATQTAGNNAPDVIQMDYAFIGEYARRESLLALDDYVPDKLDLSDFPDNTLTGGKIDGKLYGVNAGVNSWAMLYNVALLDETGIEMPDETLTWDDLASLIPEITGKTADGIYGSSDGTGIGPGLECWVRQRGKPGLYTEDGQLGFDKQDLTDWFEYWATLRDSGAVVPPDVQSAAQGDVQNSLVVNRKAVIDFAHSNQLSAYSALTEDEIDMHMYPQGPSGSEPGQYLKPSMLWSVYSKSKNVDAAIALVNALSTDPDVAGELGSERGIPPSPELADTLKKDADDIEKKVYDYIDFVADKVGPLPPAFPLGAGEVTEQGLTDIGEAIAFGQTSITDGVNQFFENADRVLNK